MNAILEKVREQLRTVEDRLGDLLRRGTTGADLHLLCLESALLERREQALMQIVSAAWKEVQEQQIHFLEAKQKRKILGDLREKQLGLFLLTEGRKDQQKLDDAFLLRRASVPTGKRVA